SIVKSLPPACRPEVFRATSSDTSARPGNPHRGLLPVDSSNGAAGSLSPSKTNANYPSHPALGQKRFNAALHLLNSYLSQHSLRNRCPRPIPLDSTTQTKYLKRSH